MECKCDSCKVDDVLTDIFSNEINVGDICIFTNLYIASTQTGSNSSIFVIGDDLINKTPTGKLRKHLGLRVYHLNTSNDKILSDSVFNICKFKSNTINITSKFQNDQLSKIQNSVIEYKERQVWKSIK